MVKTKAFARRPAEKAAVPTSEPSTAKRTCTRCKKDFPTSQVYAFKPCGHMKCRGCLSILFFYAMYNPPDYFPMRCCSTLFTPENAEKYLPQAEAKRYKAKMLEASTEKKTYCHWKKCSAFIPSYSIFDHQAVCPACMASTCTECKSEWHEGECMRPEHDPALIRLARTLGWRQCPHCRSFVEKDGGCNHIR